jgi:hypothetical protein
MDEGDKEEQVTSASCRLLLRSSPVTDDLLVRNAPNPMEADDRRCICAMTVQFRRLIQLCPTGSRKESFRLLPSHVPFAVSKNHGIYPLPAGDTPPFDHSGLMLSLGDH